MKNVNPFRGGPSPSARGSPGGAEGGRAPAGSIPVCTGEPSRRRPSWSGRAVHPRLHGGASRAAARTSHSFGPSPSARGSPARGHGGRLVRGSIPVCTGEPRARFRSVWEVTVHPRLHGGAVTGPRDLVQSVGPSPSARGSLHEDGGGLCLRGSIPVCTGEPISTACHPSATRVHPRLHGGACARSTQTRPDGGCLGDYGRTYVFASQDLVACPSLS